VPQRVRLVKELAARARAGHPWIYRDALAPATARDGEVVEVVDRGGQPVARGFWDARSPIAVRVLARAGTDLDVAARVESACRLRVAARIDADGLRLLHGEGDFVPGLVLDAYAGTGVLRFDGAGAEAFWRPRLDEVLAGCERGGFPLARVWARAGAGAGEAVRGERPGVIVMREGDARYEVDVVHGQKTGFFLDQRDNRALVGRMSAGLEVLNLFSYTGGFSIAAALGGAKKVTSVDIAAPAIAAARRNFARNRLESHEFHAVDVFDMLAAAGSRRWDIVVCDPPSFAPSAKALAGALAAYRKLNAAAARVVAPGGLLATASCSSHVTPAAFQEAVALGLRDAGREGKILDVRGAGADHPTLPAFPEGRYLKFLLVAVD
jgi:23S rRNA (cytosine1962-C5)-methyltransferase